MALSRKTKEPTWYRTTLQHRYTFQEHFFGPPRFWTVIFPEEIVYFRTFTKGRRNIDKISHVCIYTTSNALSLALVNDMNHPTVIFGPPALATTYCNLMLDLIGIMPSPLHFVVKDIYKYHAAFDFFFFFFFVCIRYPKKSVSFF